MPKCSRSEKFYGFVKGHDNIYKLLCTTETYFQSFSIRQRGRWSSGRLSPQRNRQQGNMNTEWYKTACWYWCHQCVLLIKYEQIFDALTNISEKSNGQPRHDVNSMFQMHEWVFLHHLSCYDTISFGIHTAMICCTAKKVTWWKPTQSTSHSCYHCKMKGQRRHF